MLWPLRRTVWRFHKKKKKAQREPPHDPAIPLLGTYLGKNMAKRVHAPQCLQRRASSSKTWKRPRGPLTEERMKRMHAYTIKCLSVIRNNAITLPAATRRDLESVTLSEVRQTEERDHATSLIHEI